jgi:hypothetical protein
MINGGIPNNKSVVAVLTASVYANANLPASIDFPGSTSLVSLS